VLLRLIFVQLLWLRPVGHAVNKQNDILQADEGDRSFLYSWKRPQSQSSQLVRC